MRRGEDELARLHKECLAEGRAAVVRWAAPPASGAGRLLLVPLRALEVPGGAARAPAPVAAFWGYSVAAGAPELAASLLDAVRLPLVLDLDETLLAAFAGGQLEARLEAARAARRAVRAEAAAAGDPAQQCASTPFHEVAD